MTSLTLAALAERVPWAYVGGWVSERLLAPALVAVIFTGLTNYVLERLKAKRDQATKLCDALRTDLGVLQQLAGDYWGRAAKAGDVLQEAKMVTLQTEVISTVMLLRTDFDLDLGDDQSLALLADAITGGAFGTTGRKADPDRLKHAYTRLGDLRFRTTEARWRRMKATGW